MTINETRQKILDSDEFVIFELKKVQTLYTLKEVIRYDHDRGDKAHTESVAEHIYAMHCLADYFLPFEDTEGEWDKEKIHQMIQYHEIDEIKTGDKPSHYKSKSEIAYKKVATNIVIEKLPETMQAEIQKLLDEYTERKTIEAKFVKAIDKIEPVFHLYNEAGSKTFKDVKATKDDHDRVKYPYVKEFPIIKRFCDVMSETFEKEGFYYK